METSSQSVLFGINNKMNNEMQKNNFKQCRIKLTLTPSKTTQNTKIQQFSLSFVFSYWFYTILAKPINGSNFVNVRLRLENQPRKLKERICCVVSKIVKNTGLKMDGTEAYLRVIQQSKMHYVYLTVSYFQKKTNELIYFYECNIFLFFSYFDTILTFLFLEKTTKIQNSSRPTKTNCQIILNPEPLQLTKKLYLCSTKKMWQKWKNLMAEEKRLVFSQVCVKGCQRENQKMLSSI